MALGLVEKHSNTHTIHGNDGEWLDPYAVPTPTSNKTDLSYENTCQITNLDGIEDGFQMQAFDLFLERQNLISERVNREGIKQQLYYFLEEYLTKKSYSQYEYQIREQKLFSPDWEIAMSTVYEEALEQSNLPEEIRAIREAELHSFNQIEEFMLEQAAQAARGDRAEDPLGAILFSPGGNYDSEYAYVSGYTLRQDLDGRYYVDVTNRKVFLEDNDLYGFRDQMIQAPDYGMQKYSTDYFPDSPNLEMLGNILIGLEQNVQFIIQELDHDRSVDDHEQRLLENFEDEIEAFTDAIIDIEYFSYEELKQLFKYFLVKAKVHFDLENSMKQWGADVVQDIQGISLRKNSGTSYIYAKDSSGNMLQQQLLDNISVLEFLLVGSCGTMGQAMNIQESTSAQIIKAFTPSKLNLFGHGTESSDQIFICKGCGKFYLIAAGGNKHKCDVGCGCDVNCE